MPKNEDGQTDGFQLYIVDSVFVLGIWGLDTLPIKMGMTQHVSRYLKGELAWDTVNQLWVISNIMLFKTVTPLKNLKNEAIQV